MPAVSSVLCCASYAHHYGPAGVFTRLLVAKSARLPHWQCGPAISPLCESCWVWSGDQTPLPELLDVISRSRATLTQGRVSRSAVAGRELRHWAATFVGAALASSTVCSSYVWRGVASCSTRLSQGRAGELNRWKSERWSTAVCRPFTFTGLVKTAHASGLCARTVFSAFSGSVWCAS